MSNDYQVRRATTDDLGDLVVLWRGVDLPIMELEKRFTEFQVVEGPDKKVLAAIGLQISGTEGKVHSETFSDFALTDTLRPKLWERLQTVAKNHGLFRLWTDESAPFWKRDAGFAEASDELRQKLPPLFGEQRPGWLTLQLRENSASPINIEKELAMFQEAAKAEREEMMKKGRTIQIIATILAALLFGFILVGGILILKKQQEQRQQSRYLK